MSCMNQVSFGSQFCVKSDASLNQQVHASQAGNHEVISTADLLAAMHVHSQALCLAFRHLPLVSAGRNEPTSFTSDSGLSTAYLFYIIPPHWPCLTA